MKAIIAYLTFDGNCREAMTFYAAALGAELQIMTFADVPECPPQHQHLVMHANIRTGGGVLMASDGKAGDKVTMGDNFSLSIDCETSEEQERFFHGLAEGGEVTMPLQDTFWGAHFGMLKDKFGIQWMFNRELPKK